jgi:hypothetical protein
MSRNVTIYSLWGKSFSSALSREQCGPPISRLSGDTSQYFIVLGTYYCMFAFYGIMLFTSYCIVFPFYCIIFVRIICVLFTFYCIGLYYCIWLFYFFIFFCTRVGLLPPGESPIAVKKIKIIIIICVECSFTILCKAGFVIDPYP